MSKASEKRALDAFENAFDKDVFFDHKPTPEELLNIRISAVYSAAEQDTLKRVGEEMISRGKVGMDALPKRHESDFWKGYWQAYIDKGESLKQGIMPTEAKK